MIPLVVVTQIVLYVALDGPLFRYRFPLQPLITLLGAAGLALVLRRLGVAWREARVGARGGRAIEPGLHGPATS